MFSSCQFFSFQPNIARVRLARRPKASQSPPVTLISLSLSLSLSLIMATARVLRRSLSAPPRPQLPAQSLRSQQTVAHRRYPPPLPHDFSNPCEFLGSWRSPPPTSDPREAEVRLDRLRREYVRQVKQMRREYTYEMELQRQEQQRKDDARREALRLAKEERKAAKAAAAVERAAQRKAFQEEFRQILMTERAQKLELWRAKENLREQKKTEKKELLRQQSSMWIAEENLEKKISEAIADTTPL